MLGALWLCAALTSTASGGIPVSSCTTLARRGGEVGAGEDEVGRDDRDGARAVVEDERLRDHRVVDAVGEARPQRPRRRAAGRTAG